MFFFYDYLEFKKISEYIICSILLAGIFLLNKNKNKFEPKIYRNVLLSIICTIISELAFTFYISNYGFSNLIGHYFKIFSFYLIYRAIIETGIRKPYELIFKELAASNKNLQNEINARIQVEKDREMIIAKLQRTLSEVKTLSGLLPICSHCRKIRNDKGYWNQLEDYIHEHSDVRFSHGICQECAKTHYPGYDIYDD